MDHIIPHRLKWEKKEQCFHYKIFGGWVYVPLKNLKTTSNEIIPPFHYILEESYLVIALEGKIYVLCHCTIHSRSREVRLTRTRTGTSSARFFIRVAKTANREIYNQIHLEQRTSLDDNLNVTIFASFDSRKQQHPELDEWWWWASTPCRIDKPKREMHLLQCDLQYDLRLLSRGSARDCQSDRAADMDGRGSNARISVTPRRSF